jgi:hypothetical protein
MDVLHPRCCGLDVHKNSISACILVQEAGRVQKHQRRSSLFDPIHYGQVFSARDPRIIQLGLKVSF